MAARRLALLALLLWLTPLAGAQAGGESVVLDGVDQYRVVDPLFECVRVVLSYRGEGYSPAYVQGISGAAFRIAGPCPCAPTCSAAMETQDLARLFGYEAVHLPLYGEGMDVEKETLAVVARVKDEIRAGRPAIVWHAFTTAEWDVVCGFDDEKHQFLGRGSYAGIEEYARADEKRAGTCDVCPALGAILVGEKTGEFEAREAELAALEEAVRHAHSPRDRFVAELGDGELPWRFREGLGCYDAWIARFRTDPRRVPDGLSDRYPLGVYHSTHGAASEFMRELALRYPETRNRFERAAEHFAAEADALDELHAEVFECWEGWKEPDPAKGARAVELLTEARDSYARGIEMIARGLEAVAPERAARAKSPAGIERGEGRLSLGMKGPQKLAWEQGRDCTFVGALAAALSVTEHPYTYTDLMGLSGLAFRVRWANEQAKTRWCPSAAVGEMPDEHQALAALTGWELPSEWVEAEGRDNEALRERIVADLDAGKPVLSYPAHYNMALVCGYEDGGRTLLVSDYMAEEMPARVAVEDLGPLQTYLGEYTEPPPLREALAAALRMAVEHWRRERHDGGLPGREYWYGDAAFGAWIGDLGGFEGLSDDARKGLVGLDPWVWTTLRDARAAGVQFLRDWATVVDGEAREALGRAAGLYDEEVKVLDALLGEKRKAEAEQDWSEAARQGEIEALSQARELEGKAVAELGAALAAMGADG